MKTMILLRPAAHAGFSYGFSDIVDGERDMDTILRQDRETLEKAGIDGHYVLCPHSLSGYEATLWAQKYPDEVEGIVGLDMCTSNCKSKELMEKEQKLLTLAVAINKFEKATCLVRFGSLDQSGTLSEDENKIFTEICCHKLLNKTVMSENEIDLSALYDELNSSAYSPNAFVPFAGQYTI